MKANHRIILCVYVFNTWATTEEGGALYIIAYRVKDCGKETDRVFVDPLSISVII